MHEHNDRYTPSADGAALAYHMEEAREGAPTLMMCNGLATDHFYWRHVWERARGEAGLLTWDYRGHGRAQPVRRPDEVTLGDVADDALRVMDAAGVERAHVAGFSFGCQVTLELWRRAPDRVSGVALVLGTFERPFDAVVHPAVGPSLYRLARPILPTLGALSVTLSKPASRAPLVGWAFARASGQLDPGVSPEAFAPFFRHMAEVDARSWAAMLRAAQEHSAADVLPTIDVPALVVGGGRDVMTPPAASAAMRDAIPECDYLFLPRAGHTGLISHPDAILERLLPWLGI
jgi:pimeloyl-ACP methyl ester carboxylesterase